MTEVMESPHKQALDEPSRQLLWELGRLNLTDREAFYARLDQKNHDREATHKAALAAAALEHDRIRRSAEVEREKLELQVQQERARREEEDRKALERQRREKAEWELAEKRKEIERIQAAEAKEKKAAEARQAAAAAAAEKDRVAKEKRDAESAKKVAEKQEADKRAADAEKRTKDAAAAVLKAKPPSKPVVTQLQTVQATPRPVQATPQPVQGNPAREAEHRRYLEIHKRLKGLRSFLADQVKHNALLKKRMGDMRRSIRKCVGQLTEGRGANKAPLLEISNILKEAALVAHPQADITLFLASSPPNATNTQGSALLIYQLNIFAKAIISQFIDEAGVSPKFADPVGIVASQIFSSAEFLWNGISLVDILIAKFHVVCPVLFGIYGDEKTTEGKLRLGWQRESKDGAFVSEQRHSERMTGLGAGFAALALRNYDKAKASNPYPIHHFWRALAAIINTPRQQVTQTHFIVLKNLIENNEARILEFFGDAGILALRKALVDFPRLAAGDSVAAKAVAIMPDVLRRDKKLYL
ncbi:MAG: hypothetical protein Q9187_005112 [Circinaria calcarea]